MLEREKVTEELKHLLRYHRQACHEFFDEAQRELAERCDIVLGYLESDDVPFGEIRRVIELLSLKQGELRKRVEDLEYLTNRMMNLLR